MPRRKKAVGDGLLGLVSMLSWWACMLVGVVGWWVCWSYAATPIAAPRDTPMKALVMSAFWHGLASAGQYAVPIVCGAAAVVSWVRGRKA